MDYNKYIDHTLLKADASIAAIKKLCAEAKEYDFASVCVNPGFVKLCAEELNGTDVTVCTVVGFPLGATSTESKVFETKQAVKDACLAYRNFFTKKSKFPKFMSKRYDKPSFYVDNVKIKFTDTHVKLENIAKGRKKNRQKLNWVKLSEKNKIPTNCKYINPHVVFDGLYWFICVGIEYEDSMDMSVNKGIGIDLGIKDLAICSDKNIYKNINKSHKIRKLENL